MKESFELIEHIYQDAEMASFTITKLIRDLEDKDNKIENTLEDILKEYESWKSKTKTLLKKGKQDIDSAGMMTKMMASVGIKKEVKKDNSDSVK